MAYSKQTWSSNELITADKLNHIEDGIPTKTSQLSNDSGFLTSHQSLTGKKNTQSAVSSPTASGTAVAFIDTISQDAQGVISPTKKTVQSASQNAAGLMSAADKTKLDGIAAGAQVNSVTSVNSQTGAVNITPANIGAVAKTGDTMTGPLTVPQMFSADAKYATYSFANAQNTEVADIYYDINNKNFEFRYDPDGQEEYYVLPTSTESGGHYILTDKSPVLVTQGGTGATTPAAARTNLEITPANIGAMPSTPSAIKFYTSVGSGHGGVLDFHYNGNNNVDYTTRITEIASGTIAVSGTLTATKICSSSAEYPIYEFHNDQGTLVSDIYYDISSKCYTFRYDPNDQEEHYMLPFSTGSGGHYILTDKSTVTVPQGGTGATTPAQARANLEITPANIGVIVETIQIQFQANQGYVYVNHKSGYNLVQAITIRNDSATYINGIVDSHSLGSWTLFVSNPPTSTATYSIKLCWVKE